MESENQNQLQDARLEGTTFIKTCINGSNALSGVGLLSITFALSKGGWLSLILLFMVASICCYTALLLQRCMESNPRIKTYPDIGAFAFGSKGRTLVSIFVYLELYLVAVEFLILEGDSLDKVFPNQGFKIGALKVHGSHMFMMLTALLILPTTWLKNLESLVYISSGGVLASVVLVLCVAWAGAFDGVGFHQKDALFKFEGLPTTASLFAFCFCGHAVFPTLRSSMKNKTQFPKVLLTCFGTSMICYGTMAILGYLMYGRNIESQITLNLPNDKINTKVAIFTALINPLAKYATIINPIANAVEDASRSRRTCVMKTIIIRTLLLVTTLIVAMSIPFFAYVMAFIGAFLSVATSIIIPCMCYLKIKPSAREFGWELMLIIVVVLMGSSVGVVGTYSAVREIIKRL